MSVTGRDGQDPAAARLDAYLEEVRRDPPRAGTDLARTVAHRARWQRAIREPLRVAGALTAAMVDGLAAFLGAQGR